MRCSYWLTSLAVSAAVIVMICTGCERTKDVSAVPLDVELALACDAYLVQAALSTVKSPENGSASGTTAALVPEKENENDEPAHQVIEGLSQYIIFKAMEGKINIHQKGVEEILGNALKKCAQKCQKGKLAGADEVLADIDEVKAMVIEEIKKTSETINLVYAGTVFD